MDNVHPYLHLLAARGNSQPRSPMRALHQLLHHDTIAFAHQLFDAEVEIGEAGDPTRNMLLDRLWTAWHCISWHARPQLMCYTIRSEDSVRHVQPAFISTTLPRTC